MYKRGQHFLFAETFPTVRYFCTCVYMIYITCTTPIYIRVFYYIYILYTYQMSAAGSTQKCRFRPLSIAGSSEIGGTAYFSQKPPAGVTLALDGRAALAINQPASHRQRVETFYIYIYNTTTIYIIYILYYNICILYPGSDSDFTQVRVFIYYTHR